MLPLCPWETPTYLLFSSNAYPLFYYAHFAPILAGGCLVAILLWRNSQSLAVKMLTALFAISAAWILIDMMATATNRPDMVAFLWSTIVLIEPLVYVAALFLFYAFALNRLPSFLEQILMTLLLGPLIVLAPTAYNIPGIYLEDCIADEGFIAAYYSYGVETFVTLFILSVVIRTILRTKDAIERRKLGLFFVGLVAFLILFASGNLIGTFTGDWVTAQYGLFGLPIFIGFLGYLIVRYRAFDTRIFGAQLLVVALSILVFSLLFVRTIDNVRIITILTFVLVCILGYILVRNVRQEIEHRQLIEKQEQELQIVNKQQESLLHFVSHEVKGYLTKSEGAFAGIVQGDYGKTSASLAKMADAGLVDMRRGVSMVMDILDASNLRKGTVTYEKKPFDFSESVRAVISDAEGKFKEKGLTFETNIASGDFQLEGDERKVRRHLIRNLIDNALKYTPKGSVHVALSRSGNVIRFSVKDSGVGISEEDKAKLFTEGGHGKESIKVNVDSTGYGLYIAKQVVEAHGGTIRAESEGQGKGSTFIVELPTARVTS